MERRFSSRARVDIPIRAFIDGTSFACRAVDLSATGMVFERSRYLVNRELCAVSRFEIYLGNRPIRTRGRAVWSRDRLQAVRFVLMHDADRLTIAELLDRMVQHHQPLH